MPIWDGTADLWSLESAEPWAARLKDAFGEPAPYWNQTGLMWGTYDGHCLECSRGDTGDIELLRFRIDLRSGEFTLVERVLGFARQYELLLLTGEGQPTEPAIRELASFARSSAAARFVRDPIAFFERLPKVDE